MHIHPLFKDNLAQLPGVSHLSGIVLHSADGSPAGLIENKPGQQGSLAVYHYLAHVCGPVIDARFSSLGLALYGEHVADAKQHPGKHPNIDRLLAAETDTASPRHLTITLLPQLAA